MWCRSTFFQGYCPRKPITIQLTRMGSVDFREITVAAGSRSHKLPLTMWEQLPAEICRIDSQSYLLEFRTTHKKAPLPVAAAHLVRTNVPIWPGPDRCASVAPQGQQRGQPGEPALLLSERGPPGPELLLPAGEAHPVFLNGVVEHLRRRPALGSRYPSESFDELGGQHKISRMSAAHSLALLLSVAGKRSTLHPRRTPSLFFSASLRAPATV